MAAERARTGVSGRIAIRLNIPPEPLPERPAARARVDAAGAATRYQLRRHEHVPLPEWSPTSLVTVRRARQGVK